MCVCYLKEWTCGRWADVVIKRIIADFNYIFADVLICMSVGRYIRIRTTKLLVAFENVK